MEVFPEQSGLASVIVSVQKQSPDSQPLPSGGGKPVPASRSPSADLAPLDPIFALLGRSEWGDFSRKVSPMAIFDRMDRVVSPTADRTFAIRFAVIRRRLPQTDVAEPTRQMIINDDLGAFADVSRELGLSAARLESDILAKLVNSNPAMSDGIRGVRWQAERHPVFLR